MKKETKKAPTIRFRGFTDDWEQRKLGKLVEFYNGDRSSRYPNDSDMVSEGVPFITAGDLVSGRVKLDTANKITEEKFNELSGAKIQRGDIIYCLRGTLGKNAFVDNFDVGTVASSLVDIRPKKVVGKYLYQVLNSDIEYTQRIVNDEGAAQPNLSAKNLSLFNIPMPDEVEQEKIAAYFDDLDNLITLHQRKLDQLKKLKKYFLQNMFPAKGEKVPRIRFKGFTGDWEQRKLDELATFINGRAYSQDELLDNGKYKVLRVGNFYTNDSWYYSDMELDDKYYANEGDLLYTWSATFGPHIWHGEKVIYHYHIWKINLSDNLKKNFALQLLEQDKAAILSDKNGSTMVHITKMGMEKKKVIIPLNIEEQEKIGKFFSDLDRNITLHQRKLNQLQTMKKFMLQNLFI